MISKEKANSILDAIDADNGDEVQRILGESIQNGEMTKDQANSILDAIDADDGDVVMSTLSSLVGANEQKPLALRPPEDFAPQLSEMDKLYQSVFPRLTSKEAGQGFLSDIGKGVGDVASLPFRALAGHADALGTLLGGGSIYDVGESYTKQMTSPRATEGAGMIQGTAEDILKNPMNTFLPLTGSIATKTTAGIANPLARGVLGGGIEGLLSGIGEAGMEQRGIKQEGLNTLLGVGVGSTLGAVPMIPRALQSADQMNVEKSLGEIEIPRQISTPEGVRAVDVASVESWSPSRRFAHPSLSTDSPTDIPYSKMLEMAKLANVGVKDGDRVTQATPVLDKVFRDIGKKGYDEVVTQMSEIGRGIGEIRKEYLPRLNDVDKDEVLQTLNDFVEMNGYRASITKNAEGSDVITWTDLDGQRVKSTDVNTKVRQLANTILNSPEKISGNRLELLRKRSDDLIPNDPVTKQPTYTAQEASLIAFSDAIKKRIDEEIAVVADPAIVDQFQKLRGDYAQYKEMTDRLGRLIGSDVGETTTKGMSASKRLVESLQDQGSKEAWEFVREKTGYDLAKNSARALQAMEELGDTRASVGTPSMGLIENARNLASKAMEKKTRFSAVKSEKTPEQRRADMRKVDDFFNRYFIGIGALNPSVNTERKAK